MKRPAALLITIIILISILAGCQGLQIPGPAPQPVQVTATRLPIPTATQSVSTPAPSPSQPGPNDPVWVANPADRSVLRIDPATNQVSASIPLEGHPEVVQAGEGAVWALDRQRSLVFRIDPKTNRVSATIALPAGSAQDLAVGIGAVWVGMTGRVDLLNQTPGQDEEILPPGMVVQIDPRKNDVSGQFPVQPVNRLFISGTSLWVLSRLIIDTPIQVYDLPTRQGMALPIRNAPEWLPVDALAAAPDGIWLFSTAYGAIFRAAPDGRVNSVIELGEQPPTGYADLLLSGSGLWAATPWGSVLHIDPNTNHIISRVELKTALTSLIPGSGAIWALSQQSATLFRIDPSTGQVTAQIAIGSPLQPTVIPSPTPRVVIWKPCPNAPTSRLKIGDLAYVTKDPPIPNRVRKDPNREAEVLGYITPGGSMEILEGPTCSDGWVWWKVKNADLTGWTAEGDPETYWLVPLFK